jgi:tetratricopeptide (TPR) repeat protein
VLAGVELELDNDRTALTWALSHGNDTVLGGTIAGALSSLWSNAGLAVEGRYWIGLALEQVNEAEQPQVAARLWLALSNLSRGVRMHDAAERAMQLYASVGDVRGVAYSQRSLAFALSQTGRLDEAEATIDQALATVRACADTSSVADCLNVQASIALARGDVRAGRELFVQALAAFKALGDESGIAIVLSNVAEMEFADGHPGRALHAASEALEIHACGKNAPSIANGHINCAAYHIALGDLSAARDSAREGLRLARQARHELNIATVLQHLALLAALAGDARRAVHLLGYVDAQYSQLGAQRQTTEQWGYEKLIAALRERLSADDAAQLGAEGAAWSEDQAVEEALKV